MINIKESEEITTENETIEGESLKFAFLRQIVRIPKNLNGMLKYESDLYCG